MKELFKHSEVIQVGMSVTFWKTIKPYFSNKDLNSNKLLLKEKGRLISNNK